MAISDMELTSCPYRQEEANCLLSDTDEELTSFMYESLENVATLNYPLLGLRRSSSGSPAPEPERLSVRRGQTVHSIRIDSDGSSGSSSKSSWSELLRLKKKPAANSMDSEYGSTLSINSPVMSSAMSERLKQLYSTLCGITDYFKEKLSSSSSTRENSGEDSKCESDEDKNDNSSSPEPTEKPDDNDSRTRSSCENNCIKTRRSCDWFNFKTTIEPQCPWYVLWLFIVSVAFLYNAWAIPLRACFFTMQNERTLPYWLACDYIADLLYILDIILVKCRISFINNGVVDHRVSEAKKHYLRKVDFKLDILSLLPLDIFYLVIGEVNPVLRLSRFLKIKTFWEFFDRFDQAAKSGHIIRVLKTCMYMLYLIHIEGCGYYLVSYLQGFESSDWVFNPKKHTVTPYIRCFYIATKTATSIGKNPIPTNDLEYLFMTFYWLSGVFVFASLIGQIRDIVEAAGAVKSNYRKTMDITIWYMQSLNLPRDLQHRVRTWFNYNWDQQKTLNENNLIEALPRKIRTDLAIHVHFQTLSKVKLFQDCDQNLLFDLILKLKPVLYLPGDYICKKGEVGTEMYIVMNGSVQVVGGPTNDTVFATLHMGSVFGEISLLAMSGGNRRTADVRSKGFSNLFLLSKVDFDEAMTDYPEAAVLLRKRAELLLIQNKKIEETARKLSETESKINKATRHPCSTILKVVKPSCEVMRCFGGKTVSQDPNFEQLEKKRKIDNIVSESSIDSANDFVVDKVLFHSPSMQETYTMTEDDAPVLFETNPTQRAEFTEELQDCKLDTLLEEVEKELHKRRLLESDFRGIDIVNEVDEKSSSQTILGLNDGSYFLQDKEEHLATNIPVCTSSQDKSRKSLDLASSAPNTPSNVVTCNAQIHREKASTPRSGSDTNIFGVDNFAFIAIDNNNFLKQKRKNIDKSVLNYR